MIIATASACGSGVTTSAIDGGFGPLASAAWMRTLYGAGVSEYILLTNVPEICEKSRALTDALARLSAATDPETAADTACAPLTDPFLDAVDAAGAMFPAGAHYLLLDAVLSAGAHEIGDDAFGELQAYSGFPALGEAWDPEETYDAHCGLTGDPRALLFPGPETEWTIGGGTLRLASRTDVSLDGSFGGELLDDAGAISARFQAQPCELVATE